MHKLMQALRPMLPSMESDGSGEEVPPPLLPPPLAPITDDGPAAPTGPAVMLSLAIAASEAALVGLPRCCCMLPA